MPGPPARCNFQIVRNPSPVRTALAGLRALLCQVVLLTPAMADAAEAGNAAAPGGSQRPDPPVPALLILSSVSGADGMTLIRVPDRAAKGNVFLTTGSRDEETVLSNIDFAKLPGVIPFGPHTAVNGNVRVPWKVGTDHERRLLGTDAARFATKTDPALDDTGTAMFHSLMEALHAEVDARHSDLEAQAAEERERSRQAAGERRRLTERLEARFQRLGRTPATAGARHIATRGGRPVDPATIVPVDRSMTSPPEAGRP